jgi:N-acetylmuramoyl-L-alanine amidase
VLNVANMVKAELEKKGAEVVMTQDGTRDPTLQDRVTMAWRERAQMFISLHLDACEVGQDARDIEGYSVHYYLPQSHTFAELVHQIYGKKTEFHDQGLWRSNLAVCRATQMPSILLEQGFLMLPEYEEILISPKHQKTVAEVLISAITTYLKDSK